VEIVAESQYSIIETAVPDHSANHQSSQRLIQGMAHEIKNPLGGIRGAAQLLAGNLQSREDKDFINIIVHETDRLTDLVDRMSGYIKDKKLLPINIHRILEHVYGLLNSDKPQSVKVKRDYDPSLPKITGSQSSLTQAFINLGLNALQAIDENGVITIRSRLVFGTIIDHKQYKQTVRVDIQDNGTGIDNAITNTIFEPLVSSKESGTGLGLSISREIITAHDGKIEFSSMPGLTVFSVFLPVTGE
jgi:two-component system nitrogen regulation sensor histidine kinase GlnL